MFSRNLVPVWVAIIVLSSIYLMGQGWSPPSGPPAPLHKTGQITTYATGDDGDLQRGVASPVPRFTDNGTGTVTDNLTGLIWTKSADCDGTRGWSYALSYCNALASGTCGLTDGSLAGDWRLANRLELESLLDMENWDPALLEGHPFTDVQLDDWYWSSTTDANLNSYAWDVHFLGGYVSHDLKGSYNYAWCVRGGQ